MKPQLTALVTGANKGIGLEISRQLVAKGFHVFIGARNADAGRKVAAELSDNGGKATFLGMNVTSKESIISAVAEFGAHSDHLDVLVNNAGILLSDDGDILTADIELFRQTLETNTVGPVMVTQAFVEYLKKSEQPRVINVSSLGGQLAQGSQGWAPYYCISKTALNGVTSQLAGALPTFAVNCVSPGWVRTDMGGANATSSVEEGADTVVWLATAAPQSLTGKFLRNRVEVPW